MTVKSILPYLILLLLIPGASYAQNSECPDLAELNQKWPTYYNDIHLAEPLQELRCGSPQYEIAKALDIIKSVDVPEVGGMYEYVTQSTPLLVIDLRDIYGSKMASAITKKIRKHKVGIELYRPFFGLGDEGFYTIRDIIRAGILVHESRHMVLGDTSNHVYCNHGQAEGEKDCDEIFVADWNEAKSYSFQLLFLKRLMNSPSNYSQSIDKEALQRYIKIHLKDAFNE